MLTVGFHSHSNLRQQDITGNKQLKQNKDWHKKVFSAQPDEDKGRTCIKHYLQLLTEDMQLFC